MHGIDLISPGSKSGDSEEFRNLRAALDAPDPYMAEGPLSDHLLQAMWYPATEFSARDHINVATGHSFKCLSYYADAPDVVAYCMADGDNHLATIGAPFIRRLVKICDRLDAVLQRRPTISKDETKLERDPELSALLAGDVQVDEAEANEIVSRWPEAGKEGQQIPLGPWALFYDLVRLVWVHEWAHALTGHVRFAARDLQLMGLEEFSAQRANFRMPGETQPPAHEIFQAIELHADEFATRYLTHEILWGYDPVGRLAGPKVNLVDRFLIYNVAFCVFAVMWWMSERRHWPEQSFYPQRQPLESNEPEPIFGTFTTTHPPAALRYMRFRDFQRELTAAASAEFGASLSPSVDSASFLFLNGPLTEVDGHFGAFTVITPVIARTPTMKLLIEYEAHLLEHDAFISPRLVELGYQPTRNPFAE